MDIVLNTEEKLSCKRIRFKKPYSIHLQNIRETHMKKLKLIITLCFAIATVGSINAQSTISKKPTINSSEKKPEKITHKEIDYYIIDGVWYAKMNKRFVLRPAPKGAILKDLPNGTKKATLGGIKYQKLNGVFYKKRKDGLYEVVRP